jgi:hypothetical protein
MPRPNIISGHAPGHLRDAFCELIDTPESPELQRLTGKLWNCTDILPGWFCGEVDLPMGSTYAMAARQLRRQAAAT